MKVSNDQIKELRKMIPVGIVEAKELLETFSADFEKCRTAFIESEIEKLCKLTGESKDLVAKCFFEAEYDINKAIDAIDDFVYDRNFPSLKLKSTKHDLNMVDAWLLTIESHGFMNSLQTADFDSIVLVVKEIGLVDFSSQLDSAYQFLVEKEISFRELEEEALIDAVENLKKSPEYQTVLEAYRVNVLLNPDFFKVLKRLRKNVC
jgi:hypothetical protein